MKPLIIDGVNVYVGGEPERCADCGVVPVVAVTFDRFDGAGQVAFCRACARSLLPEPVRQAEPAQRRPTRRRARQAGG